MKTEQIPGAKSVYDGLLDTVDQQTKDLKQLNKAIDNNIKEKLSDAVKVVEMSKYIVKLEAELKELKQKSGLGHQGRAEEKGLTACASHLESAFASLVTRDNKFLELQVKVSELLGEVLCLSSAAKDKYNDNA